MPTSPLGQQEVRKDTAASGSMTGIHNRGQGISISATAELISQFRNTTSAKSEKTRGTSSVRQPSFTGAVLSRPTPQHTPQPNSPNHSCLDRQRAPLPRPQPAWHPTEVVQQTAGSGHCRCHCLRYYRCCPLQGRRPPQPSTAPAPPLLQTAPGAAHAAAPGGSEQQLRCCRCR